MSTPKVGDRVRVVIEGPVLDIASGGKATIGTRSMAYTWIPIAESIPGVSVSVEVLPPPEPEWQAGDVVVDAEGTTYQRGLHGGWHSFTADRLRWADDPIRPLTLVVRFGKPVRS